MGRVVITHSTYIDGLIPWLKALALEEGIQTVTPAVISRVKGRSPGLQIRLSSPIRGGFKLVARRGQLAQEVFVVTELNQSTLVEQLKNCQPGIRKRSPQNTE
ncbi:MAG: DUF2103 domain-containing protein [Prochlorococcus sp.]|nr:hypothetical protein [Prochlorococcus sp.]